MSKDYGGCDCPKCQDGRYEVAWMRSPKDARPKDKCYAEEAKA